MPVDFEISGDWWKRLTAAGFDAERPAVVASTGVSTYITKEATAATLRQLLALAPGSTLAMTFLLRSAGFRDAWHVSSKTLAERYFAGRADGLRPSTGEDLLLAST